MLFNTLQKKIKILFDASQFGDTYINNSYKTGIYRVGISLAHELAKRMDVDLIFTCYSDSKDAQNNCQKFIDNDTILANYPFIPLCTYKTHRDQWKKLGLIKNSFIYISLIHAFSDDLLQMKNAIKTIFIHDIIPILFNFHSEGMRNYFDNVIFARLDAKTHIWTDSESTKNDVLAYLPKVKNEQITKIILAADHFFKPASIDKIDSIRQKYNLKKNDKYISSVCTLEPRKNLLRTIKCFIELLQRYNINDLYLILTGAKGWEFDQIFAEIDKVSHYKNKIIFTDYVSDEELPIIYSGSLFFTYLSLYEGFGLPSLEAMSCGTPVITSNTSSLPEVVGNAGIMVNPRNDEEIIKAFYTLYTDEDMRTQLSNQGVQRARLYSWSSCADIMVEKMQYLTRQQNEKLLQN